MTEIATEPTTKPKKKRTDYKPRPIKTERQLTRPGLHHTERLEVAYQHLISGIPISLLAHMKGVPVLTISGAIGKAKKALGWPADEKG